MWARPHSDWLPAWQLSGDWGRRPDPWSALKLHPPTGGFSRKCTMGEDTSILSVPVAMTPFIATRAPSRRPVCPCEVGTKSSDNPLPIGDYPISLGFGQVADQLLDPAFGGGPLVALEVELLCRIDQP